MEAVAERRAQVKARTTDQVKREASSVYAHWGMSLSDAINIFLVKSIEVGGLPFDMRPESPRWSGLRANSYIPPIDENGVAVLPADWDDGDE